MIKSWRRNLWVVFAAQLLAIMGFSSTFPIFPYYIQDLGVEMELVARWSGIVLAAASVSMAIMGPIWGSLGDRYGRKLMVMRAMFGGAVIIGLQGLAQNVVQFAVLRLIQGALTGTVIAATALVASTTPRDRLGETLGKLQLAIFLGQTFGPTTGGIVADMLGYRATFWMTAVYLLIAGMLILFWVNEEFTPAEDALEGNLLQRMRGDFALVFAAGSFLGRVLGLHFALRVGVRMSAPTVPLIVQELMPDSTLLGSASGLLTTISGISSAIAAPIVGRWVDRNHGRVLMMGSGLLAAAAMILQGMSQTYWLLMVGQFFLGLGVGGSMSVISAYIGRLAPDGRVGTAFGLDATAVSLSGAVGPPIGGWISDVVDRRAPLYVGGFAMALAGLAVLRLPRDADAPVKSQMPAQVT